LVGAVSGHGERRGNHHPDLLYYLKEYAARILGRKADILTRDSLHETLWQGIEATAACVFE
jgi:hypothetical protein